MLIILKIISRLQIPCYTWTKLPFNFPGVCFTKFCLCLEYKKIISCLFNRIFLLFNISFFFIEFCWYMIESRNYLALTGYWYFWLGVAWVWRYGQNGQNIQDGKQEIEKLKPKLQTHVGWVGTLASYICQMFWNHLFLHNISSASLFVFNSTAPLFDCAAFRPHRFSTVLLFQNLTFNGLITATYLFYLFN